jgi:hypothetical protein
MRGGTFTASYSGRFSFQDCDPEGQNGDVDFNGKGKASFLFRSRESVSVQTRWVEIHGGGCWWLGGVATLVSRRNPLNTITLNVSGPDPCAVRLRWTVSKGTGKFKNASGKGWVTFTCGSRTYTDSWTGTLNY